MDKELRNHVERNVHCAPDMDNQSILTLVRLSTKPVEHTFYRKWDQFAMPDPRARYSVYMVGQLTNTMVGIQEMTPTGQWIQLSSVVESNRLWVNIYNDIGLEVPRAAVWIARTERRGLLLAVDHAHASFDLSQSTLYMRVYRNAFYGSDRHDRTGPAMACEGIVVDSVNNTLPLRQSLQRYKDLVDNFNGAALTLYDGYWYTNLQYGEVATPALVEQVYDNSFIYRHLLPVADLRSYASTDSGIRRYIVHPPLTDDETIRYFDDVDFFLFAPSTVGWKGVRIHRNIKGTVVQLTHRDYGIMTDAVDRRASECFPEYDLSELRLGVFVREAGYHRPLPYVNSKIRGLYRLPEHKILDALAGVDSNVAFWQAASLEKSLYPHAMRNHDISDRMIADVYGYRGAQKTLADTPVLMETDWALPRIELPPLYNGNTVILEYGQDGKLYHVRQHTGGRHYSSEWLGCHQVELVKGLATQRTHVGYNQSKVNVGPYSDYRCYKRSLAAGSDWTDVTGTSDYSVKDGFVEWRLNQDDFETVILTPDRTFYGQGLVYPQDGQLLYPIHVNLAEDANDQPIWVDMSLPLGHWMVWVNGQPMVHGIDYTWEDHVIVLHNYTAIDRPDGAVELTVIGFGYPDSNLERHAPIETGFVSYGGLSFDRRYDYREDSVLRFIVGGKLYNRADLIFEETTGLVETVDTKIDGGLPYAIEYTDPVIRLNAVNDHAAWEQTSRERETVVDGFLDIHVNEPVQPYPAYIKEKYPIVSAYLATVLDSIVNRLWSVPEPTLGDNAFLAEVSRFDWLLPREQALKDLDFDKVVIYPHRGLTAVGVTPNAYAALERIVRLKLHSRIDLTPHVYISNEA